MASTTTAAAANKAAKAAMAKTVLANHVNMPGVVQCYTVFNGNNGAYNFKRPLLALAKAYATGQLAATAITFGGNAPQAAAQAAAAWLAKPTSGNLVLLVGYMVVWGWAVSINGAPYGNGAAQGRRTIAQALNAKLAQSTMATIWAQPAAKAAGTTVTGTTVTGNNG